jgi:hypothetical protein
MPEQPSLAGPLARIDRADELLSDLDAAVTAFLAAPPYDIEERADLNPPTRMFVVTAVHDVPARPRIIAGEVAHHLRVALDLLAYQLLLKAGINDAERLRACAFPIITNRDLSKADDKKTHDKSIRDKIDGIDKKAYDRIVAIQPCATNGDRSHLALVQELDNTDKHRLLLAAAASTSIAGFNFRDADGSVTTVPHSTYLPIEAGAMLKVRDASPGYRLPGLAHTVAFMEQGPLVRQPVVPALWQLSAQIRQTVQGFADCF